MSNLAIRTEGLSKLYRIGERQQSYRTLRDTVSDAFARPFRALRRKGSGSPQESKVWALKDVTFEVKKGEIVGIIGRNGAGKSTLLKVLSRITEPTRGTADIFGRVGTLLEVGTGFHNELTGRENIYLNGAILGMKRTEIERQFDDIVAFAEVEKFVDTPVKHYSSGMYLRLAFAVAAHLDPDILFVDEVLAVGDLAFQKKCLGKMGDVAKNGRTILFVSHNMGAVRSLCEKGVVLNNGRIVAAGSIGASIEAYHKLIATESRDASSTISYRGSSFGPLELASHEGSTIDQADPFEMSATLWMASEVAGFFLICVLEDMNQRRVFHLRRASSDMSLGALRRGAYECRLRLPTLWLEPGLYTMYFKAIFQGSAVKSTIQSDVFHLDVSGASCGRGSIISPRAEWSVFESAYHPAPDAAEWAFGEGR